MLKEIDDAVYEIDCKKVTKGNDKIGNAIHASLIDPEILARSEQQHGIVVQMANMRGSVQISEPIPLPRKQKKPSRTAASKSSTL